MKLSEVKDNSACVYKLTFPDGKMYIGQTKDLKKRMQLYLFCNNTKATGIPYSGIYACVNGKTKKSKGFIWKKIEN